jgi:hypothetical protein
MDAWLNSLWDILPLPVLIGMFIWTFSMCLFSLFLFLILLIIDHRSVARFLLRSPSFEFFARLFSSNPLSDLISIKDLSDASQVEHLPKSSFSCDSLSLISAETTINERDDTVSSFYLRHLQCFVEHERRNEKIRSLPSVKLRSTKTEDNPTNSLPTLATRRSIIRDLTCVSHSKIHQSIDSLFSKDSLIE